MTDDKAKRPDDYPQPPKGSSRCLGSPRPAGKQRAESPAARKARLQALVRGKRPR